MGKDFKDLKIGDIVYTASIFLLFNGHGDNEDNEILSKIEGMYPTYARYNGSELSYYYVYRCIELKGGIKRFTIGSQEVFSSGSTAILTFDVTDEGGSVAITRSFGGTTRIYATSEESLKKVYKEVIDALIIREGKKANIMVSSLIGLKNKEI